MLPTSAFSRVICVLGLLACASANELFGLQLLPQPALGDFFPGYDQAGPYTAWGTSYRQIMPGNATATLAVAYVSPQAKCFEMIFSDDYLMDKPGAYRFFFNQNSSYQIMFGRCFESPAWNFDRAMRQGYRNATKTLEVLLEDHIFSGPIHEFTGLGKDLGTCGYDSVEKILLDRFYRVVHWTGVQLFNFPMFDQFGMPQPGINQPARISSFTTFNKYQMGEPGPQACQLPPSCAAPIPFCPIFMPEGMDVGSMNGITRY